MGASSVLGDDISILSEGELGDVGEVSIEGSFVAVEEGQLGEILSCGNVKDDDDDVDVIDSETEAVSLGA